MMNETDISQDMESQVIGLDTSCAEESTDISEMMQHDDLYGRSSSNNNNGMSHLLNGAGGIPQLQISNDLSGATVQMMNLNNNNANHHGVGVVTDISITMQPNDNNNNHGNMNNEEEEGDHGEESHYLPNGGGGGSSGLSASGRESKTTVGIRNIGTNNNVNDDTMDDVNMSGNYDLEGGADKVPSQDTHPMSPTASDDDYDDAEKVAKMRNNRRRRPAWHCYAMIGTIVLILAIALPLGAIFIMKPPAATDAANTDPTSSSASNLGVTTSSSTTTTTATDFGSEPEQVGTTIFVEPTTFENDNEEKGEETNNEKETSVTPFIPGGGQDQEAQAEPVVLQDNVDAANLDVTYENGQQEETSATIEGEQVVAIEEETIPVVDIVPETVAEETPTSVVDDITPAILEEESLVTEQQETTVNDNEEEIPPAVAQDNIIIEAEITVNETKTEEDLVLDEVLSTIENTETVAETAVEEEQDVAAVAQEEVEEEAQVVIEIPDDNFVKPKLLDLTNEIVLNDASTPQSRAYRWLVNTDMSTPIDLNQLPQRYVLVALDFALYSNGVSQSQFANPDTHECEWDGITCDGPPAARGGDDRRQLQGRQQQRVITSINWSNKNLTGTIIPEIRFLKDTLLELDLGENQITGNLDNVWLLTKLQKLYLHSNQFTGSISPAIGELMDLESLYLSRNQLTGVLPNSLASVPGKPKKLRWLSLAHNELTGPIPNNFRMRKLYYLDMGYNKFNGNLPSDWDINMVQLRHLYLDHNEFDGPVPSNFGELGRGRLKQFHINNNAFTGAVPTGFGMYLTNMNVQNNNFSEPLDESICNLAIFEGGATRELAELRADCEICSCGTLCTQCY